MKFLKTAFPAFLSILCFAAFAAAQAIPAVPGRETMPLSEVRAGMKGTARTVFSGSKPEEFGVEILGIVPNGIGPRQDLIVGKLSGANADRTLVFAGMSGSPVYVDGKLVGAISYSFPYAKEAICGITPIGNMISMFARPSAETRAGASKASFTYSELMSANWRAITGPFSAMAPADAVVSGGAASELAPVVGQTFRPIATPLAFGGFSQATIDAFAPDLMRAGMLSVATVGGSGDMDFKKPTATTLLGGDSIVVGLARGDLSVSAAGTVTLRDGEKIYAFGHPYFSLGSIELPMSESHVVTVVPNLNNSFKLAVPDSAVGTLTQDRATGIYGILGRPPKMLPVELHVRTSRGRDETIRFETVVDDFLSPLLLNAGTMNTIVGNERSIGDTTIDIKGKISVKGLPDVNIVRRYSGPSAAATAAASPSVPLAALLNAQLAGVDITGISLDIVVNEGSKLAGLERITVDRDEVRAGEAVNVLATFKRQDGTLFTKPFSLSIPAEATPGSLTLTIADGNTVQQASAVQQFEPRDPNELIATLNSLRRSDRLYAVFSRKAAGAIVGASEMSDLPPSMIVTLNNGRSTGGVKATAASTIGEQMLDTGDLVLTGSQAVTLNVVR
ncbi:MAG: SpoIVB peptidase S55 [Acidobacteria bacterium OLB17]|nr:MAG: SpoIVB peptidase S55 [Acidobacteria bacterium OLB17]MCZ2390136.1 hypothetical protein [Acidobacteriota bacterium]